MVKRVLSWFNREIDGLHEVAILLALSSFASQLLSIVRDRLLASTFGASHSLDIYYSAFRLPDLIYVSIGSFVSISVIIPLVIKKYRPDDLAPVQIFLEGILTIFCAVMVVVSAIVYLIIPLFNSIIVPGFDPSSVDQWVLLSRIILFSPFLLGLSNLLGSFTQSLKKFLVYALAPVLYNVGIIIGIVFFYPKFGLAGLAWGVAIGAAMHFGIQLPIIYSSGLRLRFSRHLNWLELKQVILTSLPRTLTLSSSQLVIIVLMAFASLMAEGSIAVFNFAYNLQSIPLAIIGMSYSVAAFPTLVKLFSSGERPEFIGYISRALVNIIFWSIPVVVLLIVLRAQIVRVILGAGHFNWSDTRLTAAALALFSISAIAQGLVLLFVRGYYAGGLTKKPLLINLFSSVLIIALAAIAYYLLSGWPIFQDFFFRLTRVTDVTGASVLILPLAFTIGSLVNALIFWFTFERDFGRFASPVRVTLWQSISGSLIAGIVAYCGLGLLVPWLDTRTVSGIFLQGFIAGMVGLIFNFIWLKSLGNEELLSLEKAFRHRFWKTKPISSEMPEL